MKWYDIEYSGGKSSKNITGQSSLDLDKILNTPDPPKFIKIENISYYSELSKKYELYEKWDSKWENEIWVNTASIISIRKIKDNLHSNPSIGEWNAFSDKVGFSIILSKKFVDSMGDEYENYFLKKINQLTNEKTKHLTFAGNININIQELLDENEFIVNQFGNTIIRKKEDGEISSGIIKVLTSHFSMFNQTKDDE